MGNIESFPSSMTCILPSAMLEKYQKAIAKRQLVACRDMRTTLLNQMQKREDDVMRDLKTLKRVEGEIQDIFVETKGNPTGTSLQHINFRLRDMARYKKFVKSQMALYANDSARDTRIFGYQQMVEYWLGNIQMRSKLKYGQINSGNTKAFLKGGQLDISFAELMADTTEDGMEGVHDDTHTSSVVDMEVMLEEMKDQWSKKKTIDFMSTSLTKKMNKTKTERKQKPESKEKKRAKKKPESKRKLLSNMQL